MRTLLMASMLALSMCALADSAPVVSASPERATGGFFRLAWEGPGQARFEVQEASDEAFDDPRTLYTGRDTASVISGRADGEFFYRVRALGDDGHGPWSEPVRVAVAHHSLARAMQFFFMGALVFAVLVAVIIKGAREDGDTP